MLGLCVAAVPSEETDDSLTAASSRTEGPHGPSLFQEIDEAVNICTLTYTLTMLRRLFREGKISKDKARKEIMHLPLSLEQANELVLEEKHHLTLSKYSENKRVFTSIVRTLEDREYYLSHASRPSISPAASPKSLRSFSSPLSQRTGSISSSSNNRSFDRPPATVRVSSAFITAFGGETTHNGLVYSISANVEHKVVTLCFRGAETDVDWAPLNTDVYMKGIANPMKRRQSSQPTTVKIHNQLHELLIRPTLRASETDWETLSEYQYILEEELVPTLLEYPGYKLRVTGHSLGGALACLFSFLASAEADSLIPKPVTCISIGSSYVGDASFRSAHQLLEAMNKLRHVRISNQKDMVTLSPQMSWKFFGKDGHGGITFKHVGLNLRLCPKGMPFEISYPSIRSNFFTTGIDELTRAMDNSIMANMTCNPADYITWPLHQIREYNRRIMRNKETLEATTLEGLYHDTAIVGNLYSLK